jgi:hypothetical protein
MRLTQSISCCTVSSTAVFSITVMTYSIKGALMMCAANVGDCLLQVPSMCHCRSNSCYREHIHHQLFLALCIKISTERF